MSRIRITLLFFTLQLVVGVLGVALPTSSMDPTSDSVGPRTSKFSKPRSYLTWLTVVKILGQPEPEHLVPNEATGDMIFPLRN
ncbi:hypothetical protein K7432_004908 [Basidiobolus ranarum]|uniref:Secreted protein n=1 Tax=Basidiobolus ranarum TaxID=34480 RepID=A0ABR2W3Z6_9FUNG